MDAMTWGASSSERYPWSPSLHRKNWSPLWHSMSSVSTDAGLEGHRQHGVVLGEPVDLALAAQVHPAIPHVPQDGPVPHHDHAVEGGAHAPLAPVRLGGLVDPRAGLLDRLLHQLLRRQLVLVGRVLGELLQRVAPGLDLLCHDLDGHAGRHLARRVAPHPVGHRIQPQGVVHQEAVLVVLAPLAHAREPLACMLQRHDPPA
jgi:hypothetical protein